MKGILEIFFVFTKMGCLTFGGGYAMFPVLKRELIDKRGWLTAEEALDYYTIAQTTPGVIAVNTATFIGYKKSGLAGAIAATVGFILLPASAAAFIAFFLRGFAKNEAVLRAFSGIRLAVGSLILDTVVKMLRGAVKDKAGVLISVLSFVMSVVFHANPVVTVVCAGLSGFLLYTPRGRDGRPLCKTGV